MTQTVISDSVPLRRERGGCHEPFRQMRGWVQGGSYTGLYPQPHTRTVHTPRAGTPPPVRLVHLSSALSFSLYKSPFHSLTIYRSRTGGQLPFRHDKCGWPSPLAAVDHWRDTHPVQAHTLLFASTAISRARSRSLYINPPPTLLLASTPTTGVPRS